MTEALRVLATIGGIVLIVGMLTDAFATLIVTQGTSGLWRPTRLFYAATWRATRVTAARLGDRSGEYLLNIYPALFFFSRRRRHTIWNCDWSSDVCSSDLEQLGDASSATTYPPSFLRFGDHPIPN